MERHQHDSISDGSKTLSPLNVSDDLIRDTAPGAHQKLVRRADGRHELVIRVAPGVYRHIPIVTLENGVIA
jgi:hypothetical protein